jgi:hypothetical protein
MGVTVARGLIGGIGVVLILAGIAFVGVAGPAFDLFTALFLFVPGVLLVGAMFLERVRYRSLHAERSGAAPGAGGGETGHPEPRFRWTDEVFIDPTTNVRMRVWTDPSTGERRYVPDA